MQTNTDTITFVVPGQVNREAVEPIAAEATDRGYEVIYTDDRSTDAEVGFYTQPGHYSRTASVDLSVIMFHGIDQGYSPNRWPSHNWSRFDVGLLPGSAVGERWKRMSHWPQARPRLGVYKVGWPKADRLFSDEFNTRVKEYREELALDEGWTVLYAPTSEDHGKIHEFVDSVGEVAENLLIKHAPYEEGEYIKSDKGIDEIYEQYREYDNVRILDKRDDILFPLYISDVLVSDESSVLQEAALTQTIPVTVTDWPIRNRTAESLSYDQVPPFALRTSRKNLMNTVSEIFNDHDHLKNKIDGERSRHFSKLGGSADTILDLIDSIITSTTPSIRPLEAREPDLITYKKRLARLKVNESYNYMADNIIDRTSEDTKRTLEKYNLGLIHRKISKKL